MSPPDGVCVAVVIVVGVVTGKHEHACDTEAEAHVVVTQVEGPVEGASIEELADPFIDIEAIEVEDKDKEEHNGSSRAEENYNVVGWDMNVRDVCIGEGRDEAGIQEGAQNQRYLK